MNLPIISPKQALWSVGFRPFFILAICMGFSLPAVWALILMGEIILPVGLNPIQWHAHEMFFGFGGSILIGFLLTASKNWVNIRGIHGTPLFLLVVSWFVERVFFLFSANLDGIIRHFFLSVFIISSGLYIILSLIKNRKNDSFKDNYFFIILLLLIIIAKNLLISGSYYVHGVGMTVGLFRLAFVVMFERTIPQFIKNTEGLVLYKNRHLNFLIKLLTLLAVFQSFFSSVFSSFLLLSSGILLFIRWILWRPDIGIKRFGNATMYIGYLGLVLHYIFSNRYYGSIEVAPMVSLHIFTTLCLGVVAPSMIIRISQGHTGRKPEFFNYAKLAISMIFLSVIFRLVFPLYYPEKHVIWMSITGFLWSGAYLILAIKLIPYLLRARLDGKEH